MENLEGFPEVTLRKIISQGGPKAALAKEELSRREKIEAREEMLFLVETGGTALIHGMFWTAVVMGITVGWVYLVF